MKRKKPICFILSILLLLLSACNVQKTDEKRLQIMTSFYPLYVMTLNITDGLDDVSVENMAGQQTGCLHDYQLQSEDRKHMENADIFIINGAGMESFIEEIAAQISSLTIINSSEGINLLEENGEKNAHVWVSISGCIAQVQNIADGLSAVDAKNAKRYQENASIYIEKLKTLRNEMHAQLDALPNRDIITLHEAFPYFAEEFHLNIVGVIHREPDTQPSAKEIAQTIEMIQGKQIKAVFAEPQYSASAADIIAAESGAKVYTLDPAVTGKEEKDAYLQAMRGNLEVLKEALQ